MAQPITSTNILDSVNAQINRRQLDDISPDLATQLSAVPESTDQRQVSGGLSTDYSCESSLGPLLKFSRSTALPTSVRERLLNMRLHVHFGILPTCALAFAVVDNTLLTWSLDCDEPNMSVSIFQSAHGAITLVHRIHLRHGVFAPHVEHLLLVASTGHIDIVGVGHIPDGNGSYSAWLTLISEPLFSLQFDVQVTSVSATPPPSARVFIGASDGYIYELHYELFSSILLGALSSPVPSPRCHLKCLTSSAFNLFRYFSNPPAIAQLVVDETRGILSVLDISQTVSIFNLHSSSGRFGAFTRLHTINVVDKLRFSSLGIARTLNIDTVRQFVDMFLVPTHESKNIFLCLVSFAGVRVFVRHNADFSQLHLDLVRVGPPTYSVQLSDQWRLRRVLFADHSPNTTLFYCEMALGPPTAGPAARPADLSSIASTSGFLGTPPRPPLASASARGTPFGIGARGSAAEPACAHVLCALTTDLFPRTANSRRPLVERVELLPFRTRCFAIAFVPDAAQSSFDAYGVRAEIDVDAPGTLGRYVAIISDSVLFFEKLTPQQTLENILAVPLNSDVHLRALREMMTPEQLAITALLLAAAASEDPRILPHTQEAALQCFQQCTDVASRSFTDISTANEETYRNRLMALELAIARILKPFWNTSIFRRLETRGDPSHFVCTFQLSRTLSDYVHAANSLRTLRRLISSSSAFYYLFCNPRDLHAGADSAEARVGLSAIERLHELDHYLNYVGQVFALLLTFAEHPTDQLRAQIELEDAQQMEQQASTAALLFSRLYHLLNFGISSGPSTTTAGSIAGRLHTATLHHLLSTDRQLINYILSSLVNHYLHGSGDTKSLSARLSDACPFLYNADASLIVQAFQAIHHVMFMAETSSGQRDAVVREALECLKRISPARMLSSAALGEPAVLAAADATLDDSLLARSLHTLISLHEFGGVIELCANVARALDPRDEAMLIQKLNEQGPEAAASQPPQRLAEFQHVYRQRCRIYQLALGCLELLLGGARGDVLQMRRALFGISDVPSTGHADPTACRPFDPLGTSLSSSAPASRFRQRLATYVGGLIQRAPQSLLSPPSATLTRDTIVQAQQLCQNYLEEMIDMIVDIDDELFNYTLFDWFTDHNLGPKLLTLRSRFIEAYLVRFTRQIATRDAADLLWRLYEKNGKFAQAAETLEWLADGYDPEAGVPEGAAPIGADQPMFAAGGGAGADEMQVDPRRPRAISLEERAQYLTRALECLHNSGTARSVGGAFEAKLLAATQRIRDKLEMAHVQCSLRDALQALRDRTDPTNAEQVELLDGALRDIKRKFYENEALREIAETFKLSESMLSILALAGFFDREQIEYLWTDVIQKVFEECRNNLQELGDRIVALYDHYKGKPPFFPLEKVVFELEFQSCKRVLNQSFVSTALLRSHIPLVSLLQSYTSIVLKKQDSVWTRECGQPYWLYQAALSLLETLLEQRFNREDELRSQRLKVRSFANDMLAAVAVAISPLSGPAARTALGEATFAEQIAMRVDRLQRHLELSRTP